MSKKIEETKEIKSVKDTRSTRTKKNKKLYGQKIVIKDKKIHKAIITLLIISLLVNGLVIINFLTFNHNKVKVINKIKEKEIVTENIVFLGDSITWMYDLDKYYPEKNVVNSGIDGNTTTDVLNDMKKRIYQYNPSKIIILIGTNDIIRGKTKKEIVDNIQKIVKEIQEKRPKCKIYIESIYPINDSDDDKVNKQMVKNRTNKLIMEINNELKEATKQLNITYINIYDHLINEEGKLKLEYTKEGLHLSEEGYIKVTEILKEYIG